MEQEKELPLPNWLTAPDWAMWCCIDCLGDFEYHELKPEPTETFWHSAGREATAGWNYDSTNWQNSLQKRPESPEKYTGLW